MSKSVGNIRAIGDLLDEHDGQTIRAFVLSTHYRRPLDFSDAQLANTARSLETFHRLFDRIRRATGTDLYAGGAPIDPGATAEEATGEDAAFVKEVLGERLRFYEAMDSDFNTAGALAALHGMAAAINRHMDARGVDAGDDEAAAKLAAAAGATLVATGRILGLFERPPARGEVAGADRAQIEKLIEQRADARKAGDYAAADAIRDRLAGMGVVLEDTPAGTIWRPASAPPE